MPFVSDDIPNLIQGVSQQAPAARRPTQSQEELNTFLSAIEGNGKRPPFEYLQEVLSSVSIKPYVHWIKRDRNQNYAVVITNNTLLVVDITNSEIDATIDLTGGPLAQAGSDLRRAFTAHTNGDTTFIANRSVLPAAGGATHPTRPFEALLNVRSSGFQKRFTVTVNGTVVANLLTVEADNAAYEELVGTDYIAQALVDTADFTVVWGARDDTPVGQSGLSGVAGFTVTRKGSVIHVSSATDFTIEVTDDQGGEALTVAKGSVNRWSELPKDSPVDGFTVQITGDDTNDYDGYYLKWEEASKSWVECPEPGSRVGLDAGTMPYVLQRAADLSWSIAQGNWGQRTAGNNLSNEDPPFVGKSITSISDNDGRLAIGAGEELYWSKALDFYDFYRETVAQYLDDDPFGVVCTRPPQPGNETVSEVRAVVPFSERLIVFSDSHQNIVLSGDTFSANSVKPVPASGIAVDPFVKPLVLNTDLLLATSRGNFTGVSQMFIDAVAATAQDEDLTEQVPQYIPKDLHSFTGTPTESMAFAATAEDPKAVFAYRYLLRGRERPQSAWVRWTIDHGEVISLQCFGSDLYAMVLSGNKLHLLRCQLSPQITDPDQGFRTHLDFRVTEADCTVNYDAVTNLTTIVHPVSDITGLRVVSRGGDAEVVGEVAAEQASGPSTTVVSGDWSSRSFYVGKAYQTTYTFSPIFVRNREGSAIRRGRLQLTYILLDYDHAGYFRVVVDPEGSRPARTKEFEGRIVDSPSFVTDQVALENGQLSVSVQGKSDRTTITIINDSHLPAFFTKAEWEGMFNQKARRI